MTPFRCQLLIAAAFFVFSTNAVKAEDMPQPPRMDDRVVFELSSEDWVTTKTARVSINVEAAINAGNSGTMRADMFKAVNDLAKADWRLTSFNRSLDQTGLERWSTSFEARIPENQLTGLGDTVKKLSKAGMQLSVGMIDFSPTLEEMETARALVRAQIYKQANDQLAAINAAFPGRNYRIAIINFTTEDQPAQPQPRTLRNMSMMAVPAAAPMDASAERTEKVTLTAHVVFAASPDKISSPVVTPDAKHG